MQVVLDCLNQLKMEMLSHMDAKVDPIHSQLNNIQRSLDTIGEHVGLLEQRVGKTEDDILDLQSKNHELEKQNSYLLTKVEDLENRSRASNLRFINVPEYAEGPDILGFMSQLIPQLLGRENFPFAPVIERAHRTPTGPPGGATARHGDRVRPRPILIKLLNFQDKIKVLRLARDKELTFNGSRIFIYPDFSAELTRKRRSFDAVKRRLRELNIKYSLRYPSTLCVTVNGELQQFTCHKAAEAAFIPSTNASPT